MKRIFLIIGLLFTLILSCGNQQNNSKEFRLSKEGVIYQKISSSYINDILIDNNTNVAVSFTIPEGDKLSDYLENVGEIRSEEYNIIASGEIELAGQLSIIGNENLEHVVFCSDGKVYVKLKAGVELNKLSLYEPNECETPDDCKKKYGDPPIGKQWVCFGGVCYFV